MSIRKRKSIKAESGFTYQVYFNYVDDYTNERKTFTKSGFSTYEDAVLFEKKKKKEFNKELNYIKQYKVTVDDVFHEWLNLEAEYAYQQNTITDYKNRYYKHIQKRLGHLLIYELDFRKVQNYFIENQDLGLSTNYKLKEILNVILNFSMKCGYILENPLKLVHVTGKNTGRSRSNLTYSEQDFDLIVNELLNKPSDIRYAYIIALYIGKYTGLRISEVFALNKDDFDFNQEIIIVNKKMIYANLKRQELIISTKMKTKTSQAVLPFHKDLQSIISKWFNYHPHQHVISDFKGNYLNPKQLEYTLWKISKKNHISFHFHTLRHTLATKLITNGANIKAAQEILRHASITTTMNIYTHVNQKLKEEALYIAFPETDKSA